VFELGINWDFYDGIDNSRDLFREIKKLIIGSSNGALSKDNITRSPAEILQEIMKRPIDW